MPILQHGFIQQLIWIPSELEQTVLTHFLLRQNLADQRRSFPRAARSNEEQGQLFAGHGLLRYQPKFFEKILVGH